VLYHINTLTMSVDAYLLEEQSCQISSQFDFKRWRLIGLYLESVACNKKPKKKNKMSSKMGPVPDPIY